MTSILYTYLNQVYANITNKCDCRCTFCIRSHGNAVGDAATLWHTSEPTLEEVKAAIDAFDFSNFNELVYCGYGEPTCSLDVLLDSARYAKQKLGIAIRINTNGLANLYHQRDIVPELASVADTISISLNAPSKEAYLSVTRPDFPDAFEGLLDFAKKCRDMGTVVKLTIVDVLPAEEIKACQRLADSLQIPLRIRAYT